MKALATTIVLSLLLLLTACSTTPAVQDMPHFNSDKEAVKAYRIGVDDQLQINVWDNPQLNVNEPVLPDGKISVPLIGDVQAGGRTPEEVAKDIKDRLKAYVRDPQVVVIVTDLRSHQYLLRVRVTGAVRTPVSLPYRQGMTVLDAVLAAGGTTEFANANDTMLYRKNQSGEVKSYPVHLGNILQQGRLKTDYPLEPGDIITVPMRSF
ncbi:XrtA/PEP-CTERM system exopolysaccharide export protein [Metallibacterium sp.]|uniref:XrtA/PEP-CTERM system exopolysaccharide export protein n=1 Tax=Metallibacterium sp. TaxID=2940281 RepID=UPI002638BE70|nr:XrtA/PEP-CTERM system exopolysaccharide export protein [Metallibacterium sp.]